MSYCRKLPWSLRLKREGILSTPHPYLGYGKQKLRLAGCWPQPFQIHTMGTSSNLSNGMHPKMLRSRQAPTCLRFSPKETNESNLKFHARLPVPPGVYPWIMYQENIHPDLPSQSSGSKRPPDPVMSLSLTWELQKTESWELHCSTSLYSGGANSLLIASNTEPTCQPPQAFRSVC